MYQPAIFKQDNVQMMQKLIMENPLAVLVTLSDNKLQANHIPLILHAELADKGVLRGHVSKANPLWRKFDSTANVLAIFRGMDHYISPSWYPSKNEHGKVVPTWNYAVVHASGQMRTFRQRNQLLDHISRLTSKLEKEREKVWQVSDAPEDYLERQLNGIVGIEINIEKLEGKWKMSQNRPEKDRDGVVAGLQEEGSETAISMAELISNSSKKQS